MKKKAAIFMDYNGTFDDVSEGKGYILFRELNKLDKVFDGNLEIVVITSAYAGIEQSIRGDLFSTLSYFPEPLRNKFAYLIEENSKYITPLNPNPFCERQNLNENGSTKQDGVEAFLKQYDKDGEIDTCIFVGDSIVADLQMLDSNIGNRNKIMIMATRRSLKSCGHPVYKLSMKPPADLNLKKDIEEKVGTINNFILHTSNYSYGVGKGIGAVAKLLEDREK
ncbi:MAG: hypothetical protein J6K39_03520 [Clostridia bacterium]|nr:hypothetical protein [Clostridia bacterium]